MAMSDESCECAIIRDMHTRYFRITERSRACLPAGNFIPNEDFQSDSIGGYEDTRTDTTRDKSVVAIPGLVGRLNANVARFSETAVCDLALR